MTEPQYEALMAQLALIEARLEAIEVAVLHPPVVARPGNTHQEIIARLIAEDARRHQDPGPPSLITEWDDDDAPTSPAAPRVIPPCPHAWPTMAMRQRPRGGAPLADRCMICGQPRTSERF